VIGPILSKGADLVVQKAEDYGLPLISLAQQAGSFGEYATQAAVTPRLQASEIARHAVQVMGLRKFAILAPHDRFGDEYTQEFWNAVESLGGTITAYERYEPGETDFRNSMDRLAGTYYADARRREVLGLAEEREANQIKRRTRRTEKYFALPPVVTFEAVFIPDEPKAVGLALPTFTYRDIDGVKFLGISSWNSPELLQRAQASAEGAVFVDSYFALAEQAVVRRFAERFRSAFGQEPGSLEAIAFDAAVLLERAVSAEAASLGVDRTAVAERIRQLNDVQAVTGRITVKDGQWQRNLKLLTIRDGQVAEAGRGDAARGRPARAAD
jgi:ABC-type branched-subunit amino acid transport system substrate-binding protein